MKLIRPKSFETNSSSAHTIVCSPEKLAIEDLLGYDPRSLSDEDLLKKHYSLEGEYEDLVALPFGEYGWGYSVIKSLSSFADYCLLQLIGTEEGTFSGFTFGSRLSKGQRLVVMFNLILGKKSFRFKTLEEFESESLKYNYSYVDHLSLGLVPDLETAAAVLLHCEKIIIDHDNH